MKQHIKYSPHEMWHFAFATKVTGTAYIRAAEASPYPLSFACSSSIVLWLQATKNCRRSATPQAEWGRT